MNCSKCGSQNCRSFEILNQSGTSSSLELGYVQTDLAKRCSPPGSFLVSPGRFATIVVAIFALPAACMQATISGSSFPSNVGFGSLWMLIAATITHFAFAALFRFIGVTQRHEKAIERWKNSFLCLYCGNAFFVDNV